MPGPYVGSDNYGKPKSEYLSRLAAMDDSSLSAETESKIWLSAYAHNNPRSDFHWHVDACWDEWQRRGKPEAYKAAYEKARRLASGE